MESETRELLKEVAARASRIAHYAEAAMTRDTDVISATSASVIVDRLKDTEAFLSRMLE